MDGQSHLLMARSQSVKGALPSAGSNHQRRSGDGLPLRVRIILGFLAMTVAVIPFGTCYAKTYASAGRPIEAKGFKTDGDKALKSGEDPNDIVLDKAHDLSGIACLPPKQNGKRACLVINDEDVFAQRAILDGDELNGKKFVRLIDKSDTDAILGRAPEKLNCSAGSGKFKDLDGEGVTYAEPYFYISGSHGCSRHSNKGALSSFILARVHVDAEGKPVGEDGSAVQTTYRLNDILARNASVGKTYGQNLNADSPGLNVEGIAAIGNQLYVGLRGPSVDETAFIVVARIDDLFARGHERSTDSGQVFSLKLGPEIGIRDLAPLDESRLLVLAGPTLEQKHVHFSLHVFDTSNGTTEPLVVLDDVAGEVDRAKAEAVWPLDGLGGPILVLFDGIKNGGARIYEAQ